MVAIAPKANTFSRPRFSAHRASVSTGCLPHSDSTLNSNVLTHSLQWCLAHSLRGVGVVACQVSWRRRASTAAP